MKAQTSTVGSDYIPGPRIDGLKILIIGVILYGLSLVWPPLLIIVTAILSITIPYSFRENDDGESLRRLWNNFLKRDDLPHELYCKEVDLEEGCCINNRGMALLTSTMVPTKQAPIRAVVCFCHGYMDNSSFLKRIEYQRFVKKGIAVAMIEYEGHGRSDGPNGLIPSFDTMVEDAHQYFNEIANNKFAGKNVFLMGESMGGAVAYDIISQYPNQYEGVIFAAPMVKISIAPPQFVVDLFYKIVGDPGTVSPFTLMPFAPSKGDIPDLSFKDKEKMRLALSAPTKYGRKPRLATARELMGATKRISSSISEFDAPFIVMHGLENYVTCPKISEQLYKESKSKDKQLKLYKGMYHNLTGGETDENIEIVFRDAIAWVTERSKSNPIEGFMSQFNK